ncbi:hypothetical protein MRB53_024396 [Persea americana]|uniref:Uncharacterized protein n=1 Tax=Persea americana TaxID=3435 RepID=A0ACC2LCN0_PERAE|nr:hypothetical protein MRB53_024396 [Persea americana]
MPPPLSSSPSLSRHHLPHLRAPPLVAPRSSPRRRTPDHVDPLTPHAPCTHSTLPCVIPPVSFFLHFFSSSSSLSFSLSLSLFSLSPLFFSFLFYPPYHRCTVAAPPWIAAPTFSSPSPILLLYPGVVGGKQEREGEGSTAAGLGGGSECELTKGAVDFDKTAEAAVAPVTGQRRVRNPAFPANEFGKPQLSTGKIWRWGKGSATSLLFLLLLIAFLGFRGE